MSIPTDPGTAPNNDIDYENHASEVIDSRDMEALGSNSAQDVDMDQFIRHQVYIGWILGVARSNDYPLNFEGGNQFTLTLEALSGHKFLIPYPPRDWTP
jgi:hypothetical protein